MFAKPLKITPLAWLLLSLLFAQLVEAGPEIQHWKTTQGARVYFVRTEGLPLLDIRIMFDAGSARDEKKFGLASLTSGLLDTGAGKWDADTIAKRLESVGAILGTGTNHDGAYLSLRTLTHPEKLAELKARFAAWEKAMDAAEPRGPFRDY